MNPRKKKRFDHLPAGREFPSGLTWYALSVTSRREFQVQRWLEDRSWFTLCPVREFWTLGDKSRGGRTKPRQKIIKPQFGGLIFAAFAGPAPWLQLETAFHIHGPINCNGVPLPIPVGQIDRFRVEAIDSARKALTRSTLKTGGKARVLTGFLEGQTLDVAKMKPGSKSARLIAVLFGAAREVEISVDDLEAVDVEVAKAA